MGVRESAAPSAAAGVMFTLSGVVSERTAGGTTMPLPGAVVREERSGRQGTTDSSGYYEITRISQPSTAIVVTKADDVPVRRVIAVSTDTRVNFEVSTLEAQTLSGTGVEVTASGRAVIAGVSVYCDSCGSPYGHTSLKPTPPVPTVSGGPATGRSRCSSRRTVTAWRVTEAQPRTPD